MQNKTSLRQELLAARAALAPDVRARWDASIGIQASAWLRAHPVQILGVFWPMRSEPDLRRFYAEWAQQGMQLALPVVVSQESPLTFVAWKPGDALVQDAMGVSIPANSSAAAAVNPEAMLVPCLGFTSGRIRLGYGGGYYDRTLALASRPLAIGIAYACTEVSFAAAWHDIALDAIITERAP